MVVNNFKIEFGTPTSQREKAANFAGISLSYVAFDQHFITARDSLAALASGASSTGAAAGGASSPSAGAAVTGSAGAGTEAAIAPDSSSPILAANSAIVVFKEGKLSSFKNSFNLSSLLLSNRANNPNNSCPI
eukprot:CAMPEP_0202977102 /NCGR_PEP_ID=MMETSP1396-20130829/83297_1 /ASSEMBLY_ACC=CAM_ASM_000872 /TAXON_ID= /ORGANISM="Pseudokeronopsis sp., Strain Brazil" /LENGTH=132 /DNA_ID=CAMNT_0049715627 /DNA_START=113 /DNA_END=511 /DNA_ORIENTATION=+